MKVSPVGSGLDPVFDVAFFAEAFLAATFMDDLSIGLAISNFSPPQLVLF